MAKLSGLMNLRGMMTVPMIRLQIKKKNIFFLLIFVGSSSNTHTSTHMFNKTRLVFYQLSLADRKVVVDYINHGGFVEGMGLEGVTLYTTHIVTRGHWTNDLRQLRKDSSYLDFVHVDWLIQSIKQGELQELHKYQIPPQPVIMVDVDCVMKAHGLWRLSELQQAGYSVQTCNHVTSTTKPSARLYSGVFGFDQAAGGKTFVLHGVITDKNVNYVTPYEISTSCYRGLESVVDVIIHDWPTR